MFPWDQIGEMEKTSASLLLRMRDPSEADWRRFYDTYQAPVVRYGQKLGLSTHESYDVLQETMITLMDKMEQFEYDPKRGKFRNFLLTIVHRKALRAMKRTKKLAEFSIEGDERMIVDEHDPAEEDEQRWKMSLLETCLDRLRADTALDPTTVEIFEAVAISGRKPREVAEQYNTNENNVYQIKNRLVGRLKKEMARLLASGDDV